MSEENVEIVRQLQPGPQVDLVELFEVAGDEAAVEAGIAAVAHLFTEDFVCVFHALSERARPGIRGLRECWLDWLAPWESYRAEVEEFRDCGDRVLILTRDFGRRRGMNREVDLHGCSVWTVREGRIARAEFFAADMAGAFEAAGLREAGGPSLPYSRACPP
jgi:ketosteroid isomerase-like protein